MKCGTNCLTCDTGPNKCKTCVANSTLNSLGQCICKDGFFLNQTTQTCQACSSTCATCDNSQTCKTCPIGSKLGSSICLACNSDEYISGDSCLKCGTNCLTCDTGPNKCKTCVANSTLNSLGQCICKDGFFLNQTT